MEVIANVHLVRDPILRRDLPVQAHLVSEHIGRDQRDYLRPGHHGIDQLG